METIELPMTGTIRPALQPAPRATAPGPRPAAYACDLCGHTSPPVESRRIRCNVRRFRDRTFEVWRCRGCGSLHCEKVDDLAAYYLDYPIRNQKLDYFSRAWYRVVLGRLERAGLGKGERILDYGCNRGLFIDFMVENGYRHCVGYDPYVERFSDTAVLRERYDWVVSLDVIEHDEDPRGFLSRLASLLAPGGRLCLETPNADGIVLDDPEEYLHAIHAPYHVHILSERALSDLCRDQGLEHVATYRRWYMDAWPPGTSRRLFEPLLKYAGNDVDAGYEPPRLGNLFRHPSLFFHLFFGYFVPATKNDHMMMIARAPVAPR